MAEVINVQLALHNRSLLLIHKITLEDLKKKNISSIEQVHGHTINTISPGVQVNSRAAVESMVDSLNVALNYYKFYIDSKIETNNPDFATVLSFCHNTDIQSQIYNLVRAEFQHFVGADGYINYDAKRKLFSFKWNEDKWVIYQQVGFFRLSRNTLNGYFVFQEKLGQLPKLKKQAQNNFEYKTRGTRIKKVFIEKNYLKYEIESGFDELEFAQGIRMHSEITAYYNFLRDVKLPNSPNLLLSDLVEIYSQLRYLFSYTENINIENDEVFSFEDINKFPTKISVLEMKMYLQKRTIYSNEQIDFFLSIITHENFTDRINLWDKFFIKQGNDLFFSLLPLSSSIIIYNLDIWMEECGIDLDFRGNLFEDYLKKSLKKELIEKKYFNVIPKNQKLILSNGKFEEIDLIINLKSKVIIAELKCVKFPMNALDYFNAEKRLKNGADQIIRKKNFISQNRKELEKIIGDISGKEIIAIVVTNCPLFTCKNFKDIQIVDYFLLEAYFNTGSIGRDKVTSDGGKITSISRIEQTLFYDSEEEFCEHFYEHMVNPPTINELLPNIEVKDYPLSLPKNVEYEIHITGADFKY